MRQIVLSARIVGELDVCNSERVERLRVGKSTESTVRTVCSVKLPTTLGAIQKRVRIGDCASMEA